MLGKNSASNVPSDRAANQKTAVDMLIEAMKQNRAVARGAQ